MKLHFAVLTVVALGVVSACSQQAAPAPVAPGTAATLPPIVIPATALATVPPAATATPLPPPPVATATPVPTPAPRTVSPNPALKGLALTCPMPADLCAKGKLLLEGGKYQALVYSLPPGTQLSVPMDGDPYPDFLGVNSWSRVTFRTGQRPGTGYELAFQFSTGDTLTTFSGTSARGKPIAPVGDKSLPGTPPIERINLRMTLHKDGQVVEITPADFLGREFQVPVIELTTAFPPPPTPTTVAGIKNERYTSGRYTIDVRRDIATEKNFAERFVTVSRQEYEQLAAAQPDLPVFPFAPRSATFSIGEITETYRGAPSLLRVTMKSPDVMVYSSINGWAYRQEPASCYFNVVAQADVEEQAHYSIPIGNPCEQLKPVPKFSDLHLPNPSTGSVGSVNRGEPMVIFKGAPSYKAYKDSSDPQSEGVEIPADTMTFNIERTLVPNPSEDRTPSIFDPAKWVHKDDKIVVIDQN